MSSNVVEHCEDREGGGGGITVRYLQVSTWNGDTAVPQSDEKDVSVQRLELACDVNTTSQNSRIVIYNPCSQAHHHNPQKKTKDRAAMVLSCFFSSRRHLRRGKATLDRDRKYYRRSGMLSHIGHGRVNGTRSMKQVKAILNMMGTDDGAQHAGF
ncbi:hypothetical protein K439DRAFT_124594, partial [Ramaria rubella]